MIDIAGWMCATPIRERRTQVDGWNRWLIGCSTQETLCIAQVLDGWSHWTLVDRATHSQPAIISINLCYNTNPLSFLTVGQWCQSLVYNDDIHNQNNSCWPHERRVTSRQLLAIGVTGYVTCCKPMSLRADWGRWQWATNTTSKEVWIMQILSLFCFCSPALRFYCGTTKLHHNTPNLWKVVKLMVVFFSYWSDPLQRDIGPNLNRCTHQERWRKRELERIHQSSFKTTQDFLIMVM